MRYRLRTLVILTAIGPLILWGAWEQPCAVALVLACFAYLWFLILFA
jgi:hypothetical protein